MELVKGRGMKALGLTFVLAIVVAVLSPGARAQQRNKCGCYRDDGATCYCDKKAKCGCPGECEPKGCEEARERELQKQIEAETKKAEDSGHRKHAEDDKGGNGDNGKAEERETSHEPARAPTRAASHKMSTAQAKQLGKLIELYLTDHPNAGGRSLDDVRAELSH
jgi:hypothetical protein